MDIIVVLGSISDGDLPKYAVFSSSREDLVHSEDLEYLNGVIKTATIIQGSFHRALVLADYEAELISTENTLPGILVHHLKTARISSDCLSINPI